MVDAWFYDDHPGGSLQRFNKVLRWKYPITKAVLHSTETSGYPGYGGDGSTAPHATIDPWNKTFRQHYSLDLAGWALRAPAGVSTNTAGAIQFEVIGTCDPRSPHAPHKYLPGAPDHVLAYIASVVKMVTDRLGIPWRSSVEWVSYPASYGLLARQRLNSAEWYAYSGILGHEHVPGNSHGDVGAFPISKFLSLGHPQPEPTPPVPPVDPLVKFLEDTKMSIPRYYRLDGTNLAYEDYGNYRRATSKPQYEHTSKQYPGGVAISALPAYDEFWTKPIDGSPYGELYQKPGEPHVWALVTVDGVFGREWIDGADYAALGSPGFTVVPADNIMWNLPIVGGSPYVTKES